MSTIFKILKEGDQVLNVWSKESGSYIAVRRKNGEVYVYSLILDEHHIPRIDKNSSFLIAFGDDEVEAIIPTLAEKIDDKSQEEQDVQSDNQGIRVRSF